MVAWAVIFDFSIEWFAFQEKQNMDSIVSGPSPALVLVIRRKGSIIREL